MNDTQSDMMALVRELWPICRSICGPGLRETIRVIGAKLPLHITEIPTGTPVFDWAVPNEWALRRATLTDSAGRIIIDTDVCNLHVVNYSIPYQGRLSLNELRPHLYTLPQRPTAIPYRTNYYSPKWGMCLSHESMQAMPDGDYDVNIDTAHQPGSLTIGECVIPGELSREVMLTCHTCHPMLANDNLASIAVLVELAKWLRESSRRFTYRIVFQPGTIGSIAWLATHKELIPHIEHVLVCGCLGDKGVLNYKRTRHGDETLDKVVSSVLSSRGGKMRAFVPYGYDERQYSSPGVDLPAGLLSRTPNGEYAAYHTSDDNLSFLGPVAMADSLDALKQIVLEIERLGPQPRAVVHASLRDDCYINTAPYGEPQLGRRGVYQGLGSASKLPATDFAVLWILNYSDGRHSLDEIIVRSGIDAFVMHTAHAALMSCGLLRKAEDGEVITPLSR